MAGSPNSTELRQNTRRALAAYHGDLYDRDGLLKHDEVCEETALRLRAGG